MPKEIPLTQGKIALVNAEDYEALTQYKWCAHKHRNTYYAERGVWTLKTKVVKIKMHHAIMGKPPKGFMSDHEDGNGLNNQRYNLRFVTNRQNAQNRKNVNSTSQYPGIHWDKSRKKWKAEIRIKEKRKFLGRFKEEIEAANAYKKAVEEIGETLVQDL